MTALDALVAEALRVAADKAPALLGESEQPRCVHINGLMYRRGDAVDAALSHLAGQVVEAQERARGAWERHEHLLRTGIADFDAANARVQAAEERAGRAEARAFDVAAYRHRLRVLRDKYERGNLPYAHATMTRAIEVLDEMSPPVDAVKEAGRG